MRWCVVGLCLVFGGALSATGNERADDGMDMRSQSYQLLHVSPQMPPPGQWDRQHERRVIDLLSFRDRLDGMPEPARRHLAELTADFTRSVLLRDVLAREEIVYYSDYWTRRDSVLRIVEFRRQGSSTDLTPYLGPLSNISTASYGLARYHFTYKGEVISFWGIAQKDRWTLRTRYWSHSQVYLPFDDSAGLDVAVIGMQLGVSHMPPVGTFVLVPRPGTGGD